MKSKIHYFVFLCILVLTTASKSSANEPLISLFKIDKLNAYLFSIIDKQDTIQFIKINSDLTILKPTILFCQGSLPKPLIVDFDGTMYLMPLSNFDYMNLAERYNIIVISMPFVPATVSSYQLNNQHAYITDKTLEYSYPKKYAESDYLEKYVERGNAVLDFLRAQIWVDRNRIILLGHSQGAQISVNLAYQNPDIYAVGYLSGNILGRYQSIILQERNAAKKGKVSKDEAQANIEERYEWWQTICRNTTSLEISDSNHSWKSFSIPVIKQITEIEMPVFIAYGTEDDGAQLCDILPVFFELGSKTNYKMKPFVSCGHNFEEIDSDGRPNWNKMHWQDAVNEFIYWVENL